MWKLSVVLSVLVVGLLVSSAEAQEGGDIGYIGCTDAMPGKTVEFESAVKAHMEEIHRNPGAKWTWYAWQVISGPKVGRYCWGTFDHEWSDFDGPNAPSQADQADWHLRSDGLRQNDSAIYTRYLPDVSKPKEGDSPMAAIRVFQTRFGTGDEFLELIGKFHAAIVKTKMPWNYGWNRTVSGGTFGTFVLVLPRENFAAMNPTGKTFEEMLTEAYGKKEAGALLDRFDGIVEKGREFMTAGRPDLAYIPEP